MTAPGVQPAGQEVLRFVVDERDALRDVLAETEAEQAELRVVVEGLRTQLATVEKYSKLVESSNRALTAENDRLGAQVAAVKAALEQLEMCHIGGWDFEHAVRAALEEKP